MEIFDAHIHTNFESKWLKKVASYAGVRFSPEGLQQEMSENNVAFCTSMGIKTKDFNIDPLCPTPHDTPGRFKCDKVFYAAGINPYMADRDCFTATREALAAGRLCALKVYLGYFMLFPDNAAYLQFYELAREFRIPVVFHTGASASTEASLNYSHPARIGEIAETYPEVTFIMAHMGKPFLKEAAGVLQSRDNVYADLSGFIEGPESVYENDFSFEMQRLGEVVNNRAVPEKLLYGSDWPLTPMKPYIDFVKRSFPGEELQRMVFFENARRLFQGGRRPGFEKTG